MHLEKKHELKPLHVQKQHLDWVYRLSAGLHTGKTVEIGKVDSWFSLEKSIDLPTVAGVLATPKVYLCKFISNISP